VEYVLNMPSPDEVYGGVISFSRPDEELFYNRIVALPREEILKLCVESKLHSSSATWFEARKVRISASTRAHSIRTMRRGRELDVAQKFLVPNNNVHENLEYGKRNEKIACTEYEKIHGVKVIAVGVLVSQYQPWLCASLDGIVIYDLQITKIIEISKLSNKM
jgi:hypothetical protein